MASVKTKQRPAVSCCHEICLKDPDCLPCLDELDKAEAEEKARHKQEVAKANAAAAERYRELAPLRDRCKTLGYLLDGPTYPFEVGDHIEDGWMDRWVENDCDEVLGLEATKKSLGLGDFVTLNGDGSCKACFPSFGDR